LRRRYASSRKAAVLGLESATFPRNSPMPTLPEQIADADKRRKVIDDACHVLDEEVGSKGGITGLAIKGAYKVVQGVKPGFVREAVDGLLDDFMQALDPIYQKAFPWVPTSTRTPAASRMPCSRSRIARPSAHSVR
jgi:hypothetical protein